MDRPFSQVTDWIKIVACIFLLLVIVITLQVVFAQQQTSLSFPETTIKELLSQANETLKNGNSSATIDTLLTIQRLIAQTNDKSSSTQQSMLLIRETVGAVLNNQPDIATSNLNLINQQLFSRSLENLTSNITAVQQKTIQEEKSITSIQTPLLDNKTLVDENETPVVDNGTSSTITSSLKNVPASQPELPSNESSKTISNASTISFRTYENRAFGIKIQYPDSWSARGYVYNNKGNNTVVGFYSPSKTASQLGNISGVSGQFVPYLDIFVFDSKNMSLDRIIDGRMNRLQNTTDTVLETKPVTLKGSYSAHMLTYTTIAGGDEFFKKMQVYTISNGKVYLITYTAQEALFSDYLPVVQKMIDSFEI